MNKDREDGLVLVETLLSQPIPRSKHYSTKDICLHDNIFKRGIKILKIYTLQQLGDFYESISEGSVQMSPQEIDGVVKLIKYVLEREG